MFERSNRLDTALYKNILLLSECSPASIERANLLIVCKLVIKEVIGSSLKHGRMLDDEHAPLRQFFIVLEHVLRHRIKRTCFRHLYEG